MTQELIERLEPCPIPWCAKSNPELMQGGFRNGSYIVRCKTCGCETPRFYEAPKAVAAWNTRDQSQSARIAELREALREAQGYVVMADGLAPNADIEAMLAKIASLTKDSTSG